MSPSRTAAVFALLFMVPPAVSAQQPVSAKSETCKEVAGKTQVDANRAVAFCKSFVPKDLGVTGVMAMESLLWIKIPRNLADIMRLDRLSTEQIVKTWMKAWKAHSGSKAVTVYVEWQDVEIVKGSTSLLSGDVVTIR